MDINGQVVIYDFNKVNNHHRQVYGYSILEDWTGLAFSTNKNEAFGIVTLAGKDYIVEYESETVMKCQDEAARQRILNTLEAVDMEDRCIVWSDD